MDLLRPSYASGYAKNASQSAHPSLWDRLVSWVPSLGSSGSTVRCIQDKSRGIKNNGITFSGSSEQSLSNGAFLSFDGSDDYMRIYDSSLKNTGGLNPEECLAVKFRRRSLTGTTSLFGYLSAGFLGAYGRGFYFDGTTMHCISESNNNTPPITSTVDDNKWHVAIANFGANGSFYLDGKLIGTGSLRFSWNYWLQLASASAHLAPPSNSANAAVDVSVAYQWDRLLTVGEIKKISVDSLAPFRKKQRVSVAVPAAIPAATVVGSIKKPTTIIKPSYQSGYARNASESENPNLWDGLVGAWMPSLGVTGETLRDVSGNGNHGTLTNMDAASDWVVSKSKQSIEISGGNSQHINISDSLTNSNMPAIGSSDHTIISNVYNLDIAEEDIVGSNGIGAGNILLMIVASRVRCHVWRSSGVSVVDSSQTVGTGKWMQVVQRAKFGQTLDVYVNGRKSNSTALPNLPFDKGAGFLLGARYPGYRGTFLGSVSNTLAYNRALSPTEIKQLYVDSLAPFRTKKRTVVRVPAAVPTPSATYHPLRSLAHPLEQ